MQPSSSLSLTLDQPVLSQQHCSGSHFETSLPPTVLSADQSEQAQPIRGHQLKVEIVNDIAAYADAAVTI
jgi:hypothetical protein